jgi:hypothetical protein
MSRDKERLRPAPVSASPLTVVAGVVDLGQGPKPYFMSDQDRDRLMTAADNSDIAGVITRPSGTVEKAQHRDLGRDQAAGWSPRQQAAARKLSGLWRTALPIRGLPYGFGTDRGGSRDLTRDEIMEAEEAWVAYRDAMDGVTHRCSLRHAEALRMVVVYEEPSPLDRAWRVREALTWLASAWNLK